MLCRSFPPLGTAVRNSADAHSAQLLVDQTWVDSSGNRQVCQEIFPSVFEIIHAAEEWIVLDFFLLNDFSFSEGSGQWPLSAELTNCLLEKKQACPEIKITFITDPLNTFYGSLESPHFSRLESAGIEVVWTALDRLRDSNPLYSFGWRLGIKPLGTGPGRFMKNPIGPGRISLRSFMKLLNFKANHRKLILTEKEMLVTSANPHSASSAHWNTALRVCAPELVPAVWNSEQAVVKFSGAQPQAMPAAAPVKEKKVCGTVQLLTEGEIKRCAVELLDRTNKNDRVNLTMFYFSHRELLAAVLRAHKRGAHVQVILDPNKDAFGRKKNGIPNRQTAMRLHRRKVPVRWANTHGEQCHVKMLYVEEGGVAHLLLGSANYTRRNLENYNLESNFCFSSDPSHEAMLKIKETFDGWWGNTEDRHFTCDYATYQDHHLERRMLAWFTEHTGLSSF